MQRKNRQTGKGGMKAGRKVLKNIKEQHYWNGKILCFTPQIKHQDAAYLQLLSISKLKPHRLIRKGEGISKNETAEILASDKMKSPFWKHLLRVNTILSGRVEYNPTQMQGKKAGTNKIQLSVRCYRCQHSGGRFHPSLIQQPTTEEGTGRNQGHSWREGKARLKPSLMRSEVHSLQCGFSSSFPILHLYL